MPHSSPAAVCTTHKGAGNLTEQQARTGTGNRSVIVMCDVAAIFDQLSAIYIRSGMHISPHMSAGHKGQKDEIKIREFTKKCLLEQSDMLI